MKKDRKSDILNIFSILKKDNPNPKIELNFHNNFCLVIAVLLSAQATDKKVNQVTANIFDKYDSPEKMVELGLENLRQKIKSIGLYNNKAKNIILLSEKLIKDFDSTVPNNFEELISLPGIGRKSANVVLNSAFSKSTVAVDTHVYRLSHRWGISDSKNLLKVEKDLVKSIPKEFAREINQLMVLHGRYVCKARNPLCNQCKVKNYCQYYRINNKQN